MRRRISTDRTPRSVPGRALLGSLLLVLVLAGVLSWRQDRSLDLGFHLATGRYILATGHWPRTDPFTYTLADRPYVTMHGLFQVAIALADRAGGMAGMSVLRLVMILAATTILWAHARRRGARSPPLLILGFAVGLLAWSWRFFVRPELATYVALAGFLYLLRRHAEDGRRRWLFLLVPLQLVWTWSHALSLFGPVLAILYALAGSFGRRRRDPAPWIVAALCLAALIANPYGIDGIRQLWLLRTRMESGTIWKRAIGEFVSPFAMAGSIPLAVRWFEILLVVTVAAMVARFRSFSPFDFLVAAMFGGLGATALRNIGLFVVAALPLMLSGCQPLLDAGTSRRAPARGPVRHLPLAASALLAVLLIAFVADGGYYRHDGLGYDAVGAGWSPAVYPIACVDTIEREALPGPIYNNLNFGGYLTARVWPRLKIFIDGRLEVMDEGFFRQDIAIEQGPGWPAMVRRYDPNLALVNPANQTLFHRIGQDPQWELLDLDSVGALFVRKRAGNEALVAAAADKWIDLDQPLAEPDGALMPPPRAPWFKRWFAPPPFPWDAWGRGNGLSGAGLYNAAWREYRRAVEQGGAESPKVAQNLGLVCAALERKREARAWYERLLALEPTSAVARERLREL